MLRILYFTVGLMVGVAWMGLGGTPYKLSQKVMEPIAASLRGEADLHAPATVAAGYNQPRKVFVYTDLISVPLNFTWNYISDDPSYGDATWIHYGSSLDVEEQFVLGYTLPSPLGPRKNGLRASVSKLNEFKTRNIKLTFWGQNRDMKTDFGTITLANFGYKQSGVTKLCTAYQSPDYHNGFLLEGFYCAAAKEAPLDSKIACLINSVKIYEQAYWLAPDSGKAERKSCDLAPDDAGHDAKAAVSSKTGSGRKNDI